MKEGKRKREREWKRTHERENKRKRNYEEGEIFLSQPVAMGTGLKKFMTYLKNM